MLARDLLLPCRLIEADGDLRGFKNLAHLAVDRGFRLIGRHARDTDFSVIRAQIHLTAGIDRVVAADRCLGQRSIDLDSQHVERFEVIRSLRH